MFTESTYIINDNQIFLDLIKSKNSSYYDKGYIITRNIDIVKTEYFVNIIKNIICDSIQEIRFIFKKNSFGLIRYIKDIFLSKNNLIIEFTFDKTDIFTYQNLIIDYIKKTKL